MKTQKKAQLLSNIKSSQKRIRVTIPNVSPRFEDKC
jgi:hypothetical protein